MRVKGRGLQFFDEKIKVIGPLMNVELSEKGLLNIIKFLLECIM